MSRGPDGVYSVRVGGELAPARRRFEDTGCGGEAIEHERSARGWKIWSALAGLALLAAVCLTFRPHDHAAAQSHTHASAPLVLAIGAGVALAAVTGRRHRRRACVLALAAVLMVFTAEAALHSVHHLGDGHAEASCVVGGAAAHLSGVTTFPADLAEPPAIVAATDDRGPTWPVPFRPIRPREGRAPPASVLG